MVAEGSIVDVVGFRLPSLFVVVAVAAVVSTRM